MKKSRRKRYTVTFADGREPAVALAFSAIEARVYYERAKGLPVASVTEGDYRALSAPTGARPNQENIAEAMAFLGLELEVDLTLDPRSKFQRGMHRPMPEHPFLSYRNSRVFGGKLVLATDARWRHQVRIASKQDAETMGETIWHELTHALQFERDSGYAAVGTVHDVLIRWRNSYRDGTSYEEKPREVEANDYMQYNKELPLAH